jgi:endonuclease/exonuclease/phosphatase (EEP) superfamily protein YafD
MTLIITTWNSQGDPRNRPDKTSKLDRHVEECDYVMLQEASNLATDGNFGGNAVVGYPQAGAFNPRCGTAIVIGDRCSGYEEEVPVYLQMGTGRLAPVVRDDGSGYFIATLHAESSERANGDRTGLLSELHRRYGDEAGIIVGGDFNAVPEGDSVVVGSSTRGHTWNIARSRRTTQKSGNELDYFYYRGIRGVLSVRGGMPSFSTGDPYVSDHLAVSAIFL